MRNGDTQMAQRQLILISKVIQNLANDTLPGAKEEYMEKLNAFITSNKPVLEEFYSRIIENPENGKDYQLPVPEHARADALMTVHNFLAKRMEAVENSYLEDGGDQALVEELRRAIEALGEPDNADAVDNV